MKHIGMELAEARKRARLTQADLAVKLGVPQARISRIEHEDNPRFATVSSYARELGLELILVPRKQIARVRAMAEDEPVRAAADQRARVPSLEELIEASTDGNKARQRRRSSR